MDKNQKEKELFKSCHERIAASQEKYYFPEIDKRLESYFEKREEGEYLRDYDFETLPQLKEKLDSMWEGQPDMLEMVRPILAAAMKNRPSTEQKEVSENKNTGEVPVFIYNF